MANNYMLCSFELHINAEELAFLQQCFEYAESIAMGDDVKPAVEGLLPDPEGHKDLFDNGWGWTLSEDTDERGGYEAIIYSEENGNSDALVFVLQEFLRRFRPPKTMLRFGWAYTCSKMRPGQFGGGGVAFSANMAEWVDVADILMDIQ